MIIYPIGIEKDLSTAKTLSAGFVSLLNTGAGDVLVAILNVSGETVASFTLVADERLTVTKPKTYSLSATGDVKATPLYRMQ